jgi:hypothetical protein
MINSGKEWDFMEKRMKQRREEFKQDKLIYGVLGGCINFIIVIIVICGILYFTS